MSKSISLLCVTWCFSVNLKDKLYKHTKIDLENPFPTKLIVLGYHMLTLYLIWVNLDSTHLQIHYICFIKSWIIPSKNGIIVPMEVVWLPKNINFIAESFQKKFHRWKFVLCIFCWCASKMLSSYPSICYCCKRYWGSHYLIKTMLFFSLFHCTMWFWIYFFSNKKYFFIIWIFVNNFI